MEENLSEERISALTDSNALLQKSAVILQRMRIALEEVAKDLHEVRDPFADKFLLSRDYVRAAFNEVNNTIYELEVSISK